MGRKSVPLIATILIFLILFVFTPLKIHPVEEELEEIPPNIVHPFGTDDLGRDVLYLSEKALFETVKTATIIGIVSGTVGIFLAYLAVFMNTVSNISYLAVSFVLSFPPVFISMVILGISAENVSTRRFFFTLISLSILWSVFYNNLYRKFSIIENSQYVKAALSLGRNRWDLFWMHFLPNSLETIVESFFTVFSTAISLEATLGFIGIGIPNSLGEQIRIHFLRSIGYVGAVEFLLSFLSPFIPIFGGYSYHIAGILRWKGINLWAFLSPLGNLLVLLVMTKMISFLSVRLILEIYER